MSGGNLSGVYIIYIYIILPAFIFLWYKILIPWQNFSFGPFPFVAQSSCVEFYFLYVFHLPPILLLLMMRQIKQ